MDIDTSWGWTAARWVHSETNRLQRVCKQKMSATWGVGRRWWRVVGSLPAGRCLKRGALEGRVACLLVDDDLGVSP